MNNIFFLCFTVFIKSENYEKILLANCQSSDIIKGFEAVSKIDLENCIDSENGLLDRFGDQRIFGNDEINRLEEIKEYRSRNRIILRKLKDNIHTSSKQFINALCEDEQDHIAKLIVTGGCDTDSDKRLLPRELRKVIDENMFCLRRLIDTEKLELLDRLVAANCITAPHRDRVIHFERDMKAYNLLVILYRRRYRDFFTFVKYQKTNIANILKTGGVTEIKIQIREEQSDKRKTVAELITKLRGHVDEDSDSDLNEDQRKMIIKFLAELAENGICFIGICPETTPSDSDLSMFFQGEKEDPFQVLKESCDSGALKDKLEELIRSLLPDRFPPLVKEVKTGEHSGKIPESDSAISLTFSDPESPDQGHQLFSLNCYE